MNEGGSDLPIGMLLMAPSIAAVNYVNRRVRESGHSDLTDAACRALRYTGLKGRRIVDIAASGHMTKQSMSALIKELEKSGYVELVDDPGDGRAKLVRLTKVGRSAWDVSQQAMREYDERFREEMGAKKWDRLRELGAELFALVMADDSLGATPGWAMEEWESVVPGA